MRILIPAPILTFISLLVTTISLAQRPRTDIQREEWNAEQQRRELRRLELEEKKIAVRYQKNFRGEYEFFCDNHSWSDYTLVIDFPEFTNLHSDLPFPITVNVSPGSRMIFTLRKATEGPAAHFTYHYTTYRGRLSPKIDTGFTYLLPVAPGKETRIFELTYIGQYAGESLPKDWYALSLHTKAGDTIYAARRGRVTDMSDNANLQDSNYTYAHAENYIEIEHNDYTFGKYSVFRDGAIFVHPGDLVEAGQPLGIAGGDKYAGGPQIRFCVFYQLHQDVLDKDGNSTGRIQAWAYVPLYFWTKDGGRTRLVNKAAYTSEFPADLITREMSKKETKKWKEAHKTS
jgi:hypothetical protein